MFRHWETLKFVVGRRGAFWVFMGMLMAFSLSLAEICIAFLLARMLYLLHLSPTTPEIPGFLPDSLFAETGAVILFLVLGVLRAALRVLGTQCGAFFAEIVHTRFRFLYFGQMLDPGKLRLSQSETNTHLGEIFPKATGFLNGFASCMVSGVQVLFYLAVLVYQAPLLAGLGFVAIMIAGPFIRVLNNRARALGAEVIGDFARVQRSVVRSTRNWLLIRVLRTESLELHRLQEASLATTQKGLRIMLLSALSGGLPEVAGLSIIGALLFAQFSLSPVSGSVFVVFLYLFLRFVQALTAFTAAVGPLYANVAPFARASDFVQRIERRRATESVEPALHLSVAGSSSSPSAFLPTHDAQRAETDCDGMLPSIEVEGLEFAYGSSPGPVLQGISLRVAPGSSMGIVGPSGAGKSTLLAILLGFLEPQRGRVRVGGIDSSLLRTQHNVSIGYVGPEPFLVAGSIRENLLYGSRVQYSEAQLVKALVLAGFSENDDDLRRMLETMLSEDGEGLSTGQKQRLCLARALLASPRLLVLDEVSANVDVQAEGRIAESVARLSGTTTVLIVSHRRGMLNRCDQILDLETGRILTPAALGDLMQSA